MLALKWLPGWIGVQDAGIDLHSTVGDKTKLLMLFPVWDRPLESQNRGRN